MAPAERRALLMLISLAVAGHLVRRIATRPGEAPGGVQLVATLPAGSPRAHRDSVVHLARPLEPGERVNLDRASPPEIARLPRVGLALAKTIVADREANGAFGGLAGLDRVPGIGAGLLKVLEPHITFSGTPAGSGGSQESRILIGVAPTTSIASFGAGSGTLVNVNTASASELDALPGVGPSRAQAIVRHRETRGPFLSVEALAQVPGIGPAALARLRPLVTVH
jgi:competence ComEA-like helix-hairpin-helix protein